jgi:hypothetical protein
MARVFAGYVGLYRQSSGGIWIDAFRQAAGPVGQPGEHLLPDRADITFILGWVEALSWTDVRAMQGAQRDAGRAYHDSRLRPLTRGDVAAVGEVAFVLAGHGPTNWDQLASPFPEVRQQADRPSARIDRAG